jgi:hypothetical protein
LIDLAYNWALIDEVKCLKKVVDALKTSYSDDVDLLNRFFNIRIILIRRKMFSCSTVSDLHGDGRVHPPAVSPDGPSGYGFELTFRLKRLFFSLYF